MSTDNQAEHEKRIKVGGEILQMIEKEISSPSEAMMLLQQITLYVWNQYKIDWQGTPDSPVSETRKQRFLDFVSELINATSQDAGQPERK
jgi:hypothetical protein